MKEHFVLAAFGKALVETPLSIIFLILEVIGFFAIFKLVVDDIQVAVAVAIFTLVMLISLYLFFRKYWIYSQAAPNISFDKGRQAQMQQPSMILNRMTPTYQLLQAWFQNRPINPSESSVAREVSAKITLFYKDDSPPLEYYGQWAISNAPDNVGFDGTIDKIDIFPGHLRAKLLIALKYPAESHCYAFTKEGFKTDSAGRSLKYSIPAGDYKVKVHLSGIRVDKIFKFHLQNKGAKHELEFSELEA